MPAKPTACHKAREAVSLQLDGELSELGSARLAAHLRGCGDCSSYARELAAIAVQLRDAPLERPGAVVSLPAARRSRAWPRAGVAGLAAAVAAGSMFVGYTIRRSAPPTASPVRSLAAHVDSAERWRQLLSLLPPSDRRLADLRPTRWAV